MEVNEVSVLGYDTMSTGKRFQNQLRSDTVLYLRRTEISVTQLQKPEALNL
jgi:hypothetical protein